MIPVIDIFAGPGGLGEGFSSLTDNDGKPFFKIVLSIEKDASAHKTLTLRSFYRQFEKQQVPEDYYNFLEGKITIDELFSRWPSQAFNASEESWNAALGDPEESDRNAVSNSEVDEKIDIALQGRKDWLLIGGPPCQAYSVVGRVRRMENILDETSDKRVGLYKQYLRILAVHNPKLFVMENVKGLLSAHNGSDSIFSKIMKDLSDPSRAYSNNFLNSGRPLICPGYRIYSLVASPKDISVDGNPVFNPSDFVIKSEKYGIPQTRHRVILLGIRNDLAGHPEVLSEVDEVSIHKIIGDLPRLRSGLTTNDSNSNWKQCLLKIKDEDWLKDIDKTLRTEIIKRINGLALPKAGRGSEFIRTQVNVPVFKDWFVDRRLKGVCNHVSRGHMEKDLHRYLFLSVYSALKNTSGGLTSFPGALLPLHKNIRTLTGTITKTFADRFRVQLKSKPSKTITSHISQDGHYYIHYDPLQCRSFTVREAARIQTFPDNYYFCGPRTAQFVQVGNAVPPLLAHKIAGIVRNIFINTLKTQKNGTPNKTHHRGDPLPIQSSRQPH